MPQDRPEEAIARSIVAHALPGARVARHDDNSADSMVDAIITYPDGRTAALEVVMDADPDFQRIRARLHNTGQIIPAPQLKYAWHVSVADDAFVREIREGIVTLLGHIEQPARLHLTWPGGYRWRDAADIDAAFKAWGVLRATPYDRFSGAPAKVFLWPRVLGGFEGAPDVVPQRACEFLTNTAPDVPAKLAASGLAERHAFIWATITTGFEVLMVLEGEELPTQPPDLPEGVTHLWVAGSHTRERTLRWQPASGWSSVYRIPTDGRIDLPIPP
jgi:hypothetical protein